jgi:hypothetical protein
MPEGTFIVLSDPVAKKEADYHAWYADFEQLIGKTAGVTSSERFTFGANQCDVRPMNLNLSVFGLSDVESTRNLVAEQIGIRNATEFLKVSDSVDQTMMRTSFYETVSEKFVSPTAPDLPPAEQKMMVSFLAVPLAIMETFTEGYISERLLKLIALPQVISGQLFRISKHQIQNSIYPYIALYRVGDTKELLKEWPVPATNWKSLAAARERDPALRPDGKLAGMQNRDFTFEPYVAPEPPAAAAS